MRRTKWAWLALVLLLVAAGGYLWMSRVQPAADAASQVQGVPAPLKKDSNTSVSASSGDHPPLPVEVQARMPAALRDLVSLADAGNPGAACRLGSLLAQCGLLPAQFHSEELIANLRKQEAAASQRGDLHAANQEAQSLLMAQTRRAQCGDIPGELYPRAHAYLRQAALAGEQQALVQYTRGESFPMLGMLDNAALRSRDFDVWRAEAHDLLQAQLRDGRPEAALLLLEAHANLGGNLPLITPPDPLLDHAYLLLAQRVFEDFAGPEGWSPAPPAAAIAAEADALASRWHREHFQDRRYTMREDLVGFERKLLHPDMNIWPGLEASKPACSDPSEFGQ